MFSLHPKLTQDTHIVGYFTLSLVLLAKDANYPWCILVPRQAGIREIHHLNENDQQQLLKESCALACVMEDLFSPHKMNIAALGNVVPQLHLHHVARFENDAAWPKPIWGAIAAKDYEPTLLESRLQKLRATLNQTEVGFNE